ncbi:DUF3619 family protein [Methylotenera sp. 1P/1]|jgi:hypothetical protein|uniref:DUF3619 family protein n=1 Tax=Methylotenera sp. 1P/1 TaxID=1131551 RepID=UPI000361BEEE|nr:DUF3619 family protein [Methylotenera sp. 1P/1]
MTIDEKTFTDRIQSSLTASTNEIDADTQHRLHAIRRQALQQKPQKAWWKNIVWAPVAGVAFCSVMAIMFILPAQHSASPAAVSGEYTAMFEVVESPDDLDAITDPEFYLWLDETESSPNKLNSMNDATTHTA